MPHMLAPSRGLPGWVREVLFVVSIAAVAGAKLWLVDTQEIAGSATRHDALWFVRSAKDWYWGAAYDWTAFVRPPAYPLWLAVVHLGGVRQRIAIELLQMAGFLTLVLATIRAGLPRGIGLVAFAAMCFHPAGFRLNNYTMADSLYAALLPLTVGGMIFLLVNNRRSVAVCCGVSLAALWCTRAESGMVALLVLAFFMVWAGRQRAASASWSQTLPRVAVPASLMLAVCAVLVLAVFRTNERTFRGFAKSDMESPSFSAAFKALVRIKPERIYRFVPVPKESLERAFAVSPEFARLRPALDHESGTAWRFASLPDTGVQDEIRIDLLLWAIRNAAAERGIHANPKRADRFYKNVAHQINTALDQGRIEKRWLWASFIGPNLFRQAHHLPGSLRRVLALFVARTEIGMPRDDDDLLPEEIALYDEMTLRRPLESLPRSGFRNAVQVWLGEWYRWFVVTIAAAGAAAALALSVRARDLRLSDPLNAALLLMLFAIASRVALFTVIDATSWPAAFERFLFPVMPMASLFLILLVYKAARDLHGRRNALRCTC